MISKQEAQTIVETVVVALSERGTGRPLSPEDVADALEDALEPVTEVKKYFPYWG